MPSLDTNVLLRWLAQDDFAQSARADHLFDAVDANAGPFFVPVTVLFELEWAPRSRYRFAKMQVVATVTGLLETREIEMQKHAAIEHALQMMCQAAADFTDYLHVGLAVTAKRDPLLTFDVGASRLAYAQLI
jgi:predicted nucleic-acid-binding protein